jgi:hypothetical protein
MDEKVIEDTKDMISKAGQIAAKLELLYYNPEFGTLRTRPIISMMITGAKYLSDNLIVLLKLYQGK